MDEIVKEVALYGDVSEYVPLSACTTLRIGGIARAVVYPKNALALSQIMNILLKKKVSYKMIGKGSNLLCSDEDYEGVIIRLDRYFNEYYFDGEKLVAQAGCSIITLSYEAMKKGLSGLEFASGIPATVGGVTYMNAGAYKSNMKDVLEKVYIYRDGKCEWIKADECQFEYRRSVFHVHPDWIILAVQFALSPKSPDEIREIMDDRRERRMKTQPLDHYNAGSVFRNPEGKFAWKIIEELGFRGKRVGDAQVSEKHVNFIVNLGNAKAKDFLSLAEEIQRRAKQELNEDLVMEVEKFNWND